MFMRKIIFNTLFSFYYFFYNINMSLYDKYHSDININYMYDMLSQIIKKEINEDILNNNELKNIFIKNSKQIFTEVNSDKIEDINKVLLDKHILQFTNMIQIKQPPKLQSIQENDSFDDRYNDLIQNRGLNFDLPVNNNDNKDEVNPFFNLQNNNVNEVNSVKEVIQTNINPSIKDIKGVSNPNPVINPVINPHEKEEIIYPEHKIYSSRRSNIQSSRFHYVYNLFKNDIKSSELKKITKIVITIEDNYIFSTQILFLRINELNIDITLELDHVLENNERKYGYYKTLENTNVNINDIEKITIDIRDVSETRYDKVDIAKVNIIEFKDNEIYFTCTNIEGENFVENDYVKVINNYTKSLKSLNYPLKIKRIEKNKIICSFTSRLNKKYSDIDMKLLNTSNQNIIYFN